MVQRCPLVCEEKEGHPWTSGHPGPRAQQRPREAMTAKEQGTPLGTGSGRPGARDREVTCGPGNGACASVCGVQTGAE